jgi:hypothetical protein
MEESGLGSNYTLLLDDGDVTIGASRAQALDRLRQAPLLLNVMGFLRDEELLAASAKRVFLDIDPGFGQMWRELGLADLFAGHDAFVTIAENIGQSSADIPLCDLPWMTTRQPVVLSEWPVVSEGQDFTSVMTWRGPYAPVDRRGNRYGLRVHEFRKYAALPTRTGATFRIALNIDPGDAQDRQLLRMHGWRLLDPGVVAFDVPSYRRFIQGSQSEFCVAKQMYVETNGGWFSDRSACYLASGKPVLAQETGFGQNYPAGEGLISFRCVDEAADALDEIMGNHSRHARAARTIAEEYFDARRVLSALLAKLGVS